MLARTFRNSARCGDRVLLLESHGDHAAATELCHPDELGEGAQTYAQMMLDNATRIADWLGE